MDINFTVKSFNNNSLLSDEQRLVYISCIEGLYRTFSQDLNLTRLKSIIVPDDYCNEEIIFDNGTAPTRNPTENEYGTAFACVIPEGCLPDRHYHVLIRKEIAFPLLPDYCLEHIKSNFSENDYSEFICNREIAINTIHHEFAHVHENCASDDIKWHNDIAKDNSTRSIYISICDEIWGEYFACRASCKTFPMSAEWVMEFVESISKIEVMLHQKRRAYNLREISLEEFLQVFSEYARMILKKAAYVAGNSYLFEADVRERLITSIDELLVMSHLSSHWHNYYDELASLFSNFPHWKTSEVFDKLAAIIEKFFGEYEVSLCDTPAGVYYSIPVRL